MDDDYNCCCVCLEEFNNKDKVAKELPCCKHNFCLSCLNNIYKKYDKIECPMCRKVHNIKPENFPNAKIKETPKLNCPNCSNNTYIDELRILVDFGKFNIYCKTCNKFEDSIDLSSYFINMKEEVKFFQSQLNLINQDTFEQSLISYIDTFVENLVRQMKQGLKSKIKNYFFSKLEKTSNLNFKEVFLKLEEFKKNCLKIEKEDLLNISIEELENKILYYLSNAEKMNYNLKVFKLVENSILKKNLLTFNTSLDKLELELISHLSYTKLNEKGGFTNELIFNEKLEELEKLKSENIQLKMQMFQSRTNLNLQGFSFSILSFNQNRSFEIRNSNINRTHSNNIATYPILYPFGNSEPNSWNNNSSRNQSQSVTNRFSATGFPMSLNTYNNNNNNNKNDNFDDLVNAFNKSSNIK